MEEQDKLLKIHASLMDKNPLTDLLNKTANEAWKYVLENLNMDECDPKDHKDIYLMIGYFIGNQFSRQMLLNIEDHFPLSEEISQDKPNV